MRIRPSISKHYFIIGLLDSSLSPSDSRSEDYVRRCSSRSDAEIDFLGRKIEQSRAVFSAEANRVLRTFLSTDFFIRQNLLRDEIVKL